MRFSPSRLKGCLRGFVRKEEWRHGAIQTAVHVQNVSFFLDKITFLHEKAFPSSEHAQRLIGRTRDLHLLQDEGMGRLLEVTLQRTLGLLCLALRMLVSSGFTWMRTEKESAFISSIGTPDRIIQVFSLSINPDTFSLKSLRSIQKTTGESKEVGMEMLSKTLLESDGFCMLQKYRIHSLSFTFLSVNRLWIGDNTQDLIIIHICT